MCIRYDIIYNSCLDSFDCHNSYDHNVIIWHDYACNLLEVKLITYLRVSENYMRLTKWAINYNQNIHFNLFEILVESSKLSKYPLKYYDYRIWTL